MTNNNINVITTRGIITVSEDETRDLFVKECSGDILYLDESGNRLLNTRYDSGYYNLTEYLLNYAKNNDWSHMLLKYIYSNHIVDIIDPLKIIEISNKFQKDSPTIHSVVGKHTEYITNTTPDEMRRIVNNIFPDGYKQLCIYMEIYIYGKIRS